MRTPSSTPRTEKGDDKSRASTKPWSAETPKSGLAWAQGEMPTKPCNAAFHAIHFNLVIGGIKANIKGRACRGWHHQCVVARKQVLKGAIQTPPCALRLAKISN
jgi:hypothetical protein